MNPMSLSHFFRMPVPDRREEFVFGTAAEGMQMMRDVPSEVQIHTNTSNPRPQFVTL